jgi:signal transduction histidine kinase
MAQWLSEATPQCDAENIAQRLVEAGIRTDEILFVQEISDPEHACEVLNFIAETGLIAQNLNNIATAAERTNKIVFSLKSYSHQSATEELEPVEIEGSIQNVLTLLDNQFKAGIVVEMSIPAGLPTVWGRYDELSQIWTNLLVNAAQAMNHRGQIFISAVEHGEQIQVLIADSGPGIPADVLPRIFEPFFTTKARGEGTGLGLNICKKIIERYGGQISVESRPGKTVFTVQLLSTQAARPVSKPVHALTTA